MKMTCTLPTGLGLTVERIEDGRLKLTQWDQEREHDHTIILNRAEELWLAIVAGQSVERKEARP